MMQEMAAQALGRIAQNAADAVTIAAAGPSLAQLLRSDADDATKAIATRALDATRRGIAENRAAAAAAKASADVVRAMEGLGVDSPSDAQIS
jgi:hypothetical protein